MTQLPPVLLRSSDDQVIEVPREIAEMSVTIKYMLTETRADPTPIPLPVTSEILGKVSLHPTAFRTGKRNYININIINDIDHQLGRSAPGRPLV
jgi:hypothetical protein